MTNDEAIQELKEISISYQEDGRFPLCVRALTKAISSLENQPCKDCPHERCDHKIVCQKKEKFLEDFFPL